jgi:hypothetical protein
MLIVGANGEGTMFTDAAVSPGMFWGARGRFSKVWAGRGFLQKASFSYPAPAAPPYATRTANATITSAPTRIHRQGSWGSENEALQGSALVGGEDGNGAQTIQRGMVWPRFATLSTHERPRFRPRSTASQARWRCDEVSAEADIRAAGTELDDCMFTQPVSGCGGVSLHVSETFASSYREQYRG